MTKHVFPKKERTSFALSLECLRLLAELKKKKGISQASIIELLIRAEAKKEMVE